MDLQVSRFWRQRSDSRLVAPLHEGCTLRFSNVRKHFFDTQSQILIFNSQQNLGQIQIPSRSIEKIGSPPSTIQYKPPPTPPPKPKHALMHMPRQDTSQKNTTQDTISILTSAIMVVLDNPIAMDLKKIKCSINGSANAVIGIF
jgi:hypothetical protein